MKVDEVKSEFIFYKKMQIRIEIAKGSSKTKELKQRTDRCQICFRRYYLYRKSKKTENCACQYNNTND